MLYRASADGDTWTPTPKVADFQFRGYRFAGQVLILYTSTTIDAPFVLKRRHLNARC